MNMHSFVARSSLARTLGLGTEQKSPAIAERPRPSTKRCDFAEAYGDQTERDHDRLVKAVKAGKLAAVEGV